MYIPFLDRSEKLKFLPLKSCPYFVSISFFVGAVLGIEFRTLLLARQAVHYLTMPLTPLTLIIFQTGSLCPMGLEHDLPIYTSCLAGMTGECHHTQLFIG
jgi:hypothetical protein